MKKMQIESRIVGELVTSTIIPAAVAYQNTLIENVKGLKDLGMPKNTFEGQLSLIKQISEHFGESDGMLFPLLKDNS